MLTPQSKIYIAGHRGLAGSALLRALQARGYDNLITQSSRELDLRDQAATFDFLAQEKPDCILLAAAKVGGIWANATTPADFIYDNLAIETNVIHGAHRANVPQLLFLGSSCIYPKLAPQPMAEDVLLTGPLEPTNSAYAIAKIAGIGLCNAYRQQYGRQYLAVMPTNLYGPGDNFDLETSHVLPALIRKFHEARENNQPTVTIWGTGTPRREFLHVDDLADACIFLLEQRATPETDLVNIGTGIDVTIEALAKLIGEIVNYSGELVFDPSRPDGTPRKLLDVSRMRTLGWQAQIPLEMGLRNTYTWYREHCGTLPALATH